MQVQLDIRTGHAQTVDKVLGLLGDNLEGTSVCDAGCGTGSLAIPLALRVQLSPTFSVSSVHHGLLYDVLLQDPNL